MKTPTTLGELQLSPIQLNEDYAKKWNERMTDFVHLTRNGEILNNSRLYRVGGLGKPDLTADYFTLIKYIECLYSDDITKDKARKHHLQGLHCIIDKFGVEKFTAANILDYPHIVKDSCIYSLGSKYYNIETGYLYGNFSTCLKSKEFIFLGGYKEGVVKVNKKTGEYEIIE